LCIKREEKKIFALYTFIYEGDVMKWLERMNDAIAYIEKNIDNEIEFDEVAKIACCSTFHFQRMFSYIADTPLSEYIRRRRMSKAAFDLQNSDAKVIDLALKYGYDSPTAFNRAFQSIHGVSPSAAREKGITLKAYPPISFKITVKGEAEMNYKIVNKEAFKIIGTKKHFDMTIEESFKQVPLFWQQIAQQGTIFKMMPLLDKEPYGVIGLSTCMNGRDFDYYIAVASDKETPEGFYDYIVPECTWAIFECIGAMPNAIQTLQKQIVTDWLPTSGYEYANAPDIEVYFDGDQFADDYRCEVWLPVVKK